MLVQKLTRMILSKKKRDKVILEKKLFHFVFFKQIKLLQNNICY